MARPQLIRLPSETGEQLQMPFGQNWWMVLFAGLWLAVGGMLPATRGFGWVDWHVVHALVGFAGAWALLKTGFVHHYPAFETVTIAQGELVVTTRMGPIRRSWRYPVDAIRNLMPWEPETNRWGVFAQGFESPPWMRAATGRVRFDHEGATVILGRCLDEAYGAQAVEWLAERMPPSAREMG